MPRPILPVERGEEPGHRDLVDRREHAACGVGFVASRTGQPSHAILEKGLLALQAVEHRGGVLADGKTGDGAGIMAEVPFELFGHDRGQVAVAQLFLMLNADGRRTALSIFQSTFGFLGLELIDLREVPINTSVLGPKARETLPSIVQAFIRWPSFTPTEAAFNGLLYRAKQATRTQLAKAGIVGKVFFSSLSTTTIVYKALVSAEALPAFYLDLADPRFLTRFAMFHRRFSTNTSTSWDKAQPFRIIAHNGEINTIGSNRAWGFAREQALGLPPDELLTHKNISDSGSLNEMVEALRYRSSIPNLPEILAIMVPPAGSKAPFYKFWSRALEPWDGPAFLAYSDGEVVGARLDRNGFRPCRYAMTKDSFYLASEAGVFRLEESEIEEKGLIHGGSGAHVVLATGEVRFEDPAEARENHGASFDPRLEPVGEIAPTEDRRLYNLHLFQVTKEELADVLAPMIRSGKEPIGSMGDTARPAILSDEPRPLFDFFFQNFAQVTNPPLDHLRERIVTDLTTYLGGRPNVFAPKTLIPMRPGIELGSPILTPAELAWLRRAQRLGRHEDHFRVAELPMLFPATPGGLGAALTALGERAVEAIRGGASIVILSDREATPERPPIPSLLACRAVALALEQGGRRLDTSIVIDTGDARTTHQVSALLGFGATAVCPFLAFELARSHPGEGLDELDPAVKEEHLKKAYESGLLKVMSKAGISSALGYQASMLFSAVGIGPRLVRRLFPGLDSPIGGIELEDLEARILARVARLPTELIATHQLREHPRGRLGERHSMTAALARQLFEVVEATETPLDRQDLYDAFRTATEAAHPVNLRHLLEPRPAERPLAIEDVQPRAEILRRFGSGSMSFGAISAEAQRDIIVAMRTIDGRSGSGEGGENPYYWTHGISATSKQVASGRFGVTAEYLVASDEIEIKVAQGAKPGEGGQLMAAKVDAAIAKARSSSPGVDLISPPPLHDIYSIEDLRELIYELKQLKPGIPVSVKLVAGAGIGAIAAGVVKAGADVVHVSGGDGGTGAATLSSMKHAGLPWELGLAEVHQTLSELQLREHVVLRVDGGLTTGRDVVIAALLGAEEFAFGKLLLIAEGCVMARVCEKNTCPRGIATHDPKYKAKYRGRAELIVRLMEYLAEDVRRELARLGAERLDQVIGRADLLRVAARHEALVAARRLDLSRLLVGVPHERGYRRPHLAEGTSRLNARLVEDAHPALEHGIAVRTVHAVRSTDRALLATLSGEIARRTRQHRLERIRWARANADEPPAPKGKIEIELVGSAGQGFGVFLVDGLEVTLYGEANDSVAKSMSGGRLVIRPPTQAGFVAETNAIVGNCALYGATGGRLYVRGLAGDRFAVRNSGALAVVEGVGLHACEYMTGGTVVILGPTSKNVGAGMTGGVLYVRAEHLDQLNHEYVTPRALSGADEHELEEILADYAAATDSATARTVGVGGLGRAFVKVVPVAIARAERAAKTG